MNKTHIEPIDYEFFNHFIRDCHIRYSYDLKLYKGKDMKLLGFLIFIGILSTAQANNHFITQAELNNTCWLAESTSPTSMNDTFYYFNFRSDGLGDFRRFNKFNGIQFITRLEWNVKDGSLTYIFREPQQGWGGVPGNGLSGPAKLSEDGQSLHFKNRTYSKSSCNPNPW